MTSYEKPKAGVTVGDLLSEMELALTVLWNSVHRWVSQRSQAGNISGLSDLDVFLLHLLVYRKKQLRAIDLAFALSIDDMHLVSYALKKLQRQNLISGSRIGKEVFYLPTTTGEQHYVAFLEDRRKYLKPSMQFISHEHDLKSLNVLLRALSGVYEQAARSAASAGGL
jgi:predicted MarR family transcription regulator